MRRSVRAEIGHPFGSMALVYIGFVFFILYYNWSTHVSGREYVAAHKLVYNHRIVSGDLQRPSGLATSLGFYLPARASLVSKYVMEPIEPGQPVSVTMLADKPDMQLPEKMGAVVFALPPDSHLLLLLDVGSPVVLLGQDPNSKAAVHIEALVHAILCETKRTDAKNCYPILRIPANQIEFVTKNQASLRLALSSGC